jgi:hypothetical protein
MVPLQPNDGDGLQRRGHGWAWGWRGLDHLNPSPNRVRRQKFSIREDLPVIRCFLQKRQRTAVATTDFLRGFEASCEDSGFSGRLFPKAQMDAWERLTYKLTYA